MKVIILATFLAVAAAMPQSDPRGGQRPQQAFIDEIIDTPNPYSFALEVNDDEFTNYQSRQESQDEEGVVRGQYSYVAPNGVRITVAYTADAINGYQASITEEQTDIIVRNPILAQEQPQPRTPAK